MRMDQSQLRLNRVQLRLDRFLLRLDFAGATRNFIAVHSLFSDRSAFLTILNITDDL